MRLFGGRQGEPHRFDPAHVGVEGYGPLGRRDNGPLRGVNHLEEQRHDEPRDGEALVPLEQLDLAQHDQHARHQHGPKGPQHPDANNGARLYRAHAELR